MAGSWDLQPVSLSTRAAITAVHGFVPPDVLTNADLAGMVDTSDAWITERTGIKERRILKGEGLGSSHMGAEAVRGLLAKTKTRPEEVELLICATTTPDFVHPCTANLICDMVGIRNVGSFDVQAACSGFIYALAVASQFIAAGAYRKVVVVGTDKMSAIVDYTDRATCVLFGDGAGAVMLEPNADGFGIMDTVLRSDGSGAQYLHQKAGGSRMPPTAETVAKRLHFVHQEGAAVYKFAVAGMTEVARDIMARSNLTADMIDWAVPHQANRRIIETTAERLGLPLEKVMFTIHKYGNTTTATIPLTLWDYEDRLKPGDRLLLAAFGGGFTWGGAYVTWAYDGAKAPKLNGAAPPPNMVRSPWL
jgi:3-oxoacyl-[acyl-carrier-protein] synthase-3